MDRCEHKFRYESGRWYCVICTRVAPKRFMPKLEAMAEY